MVTIHEVEQGTEPWHAIRDGKYTGSNAIKLLRYGAIGYSLTEATGFGGNFYTKRGHILEDEAIELYEAINGRSVSRPGFITNDRFLSCGYSPDGIDGLLADGLIAEGSTLLEVKCFNAKKHMSILNGDIPPTILAQIHFGMMIAELKTAKLVIYNPDLEADVAFAAIDVPFNQNIQNNFKKILTGKKVMHI
jgi:hypothetical protein